MNMANKLTLSRILIIPIFLVVFLIELPYHRLIAGLLIFISAATDFLDGYVARTFNQTSELGRLLDPLADKLTMIAVFVALAINRLLPVWFLAVIIGREVIILAGALLVYFRKDDVQIIKSSKFGKFATVALYITAFAYIVKWEALQFFIFLAIPLTIISGVDYSLKAYSYFLK
ncbi:CDP-diacylglycerol--glycerol-3-phosphate 3-phosphatidyltransferase [Fuchsiella alkaliacetigena]|uniref:CDP-diacylglycerol--glycerol-3-phosphate 3-phosphatidyltransferase n=1 Tax=Fuchsiella alkaliacetigena TaxID=957042 RepID=UPI00200A0261|nr:CDP-diacylglycerol--glycerol-3-phosphate 3-phosphatidyltransferase [Fuchsiella alkaliacetigena]MCK8823856.1 CDP-diacylglycerol--glycerol-3-phosphate 3-phosphatidyltransferase [Fuchsiella alkaliacetigena]